MSEANLPTVSVVIPTHNRRQQLPQLLEAVLPEAAAEIIVVVNACEDGSLQLLEERAEREPRLRPMFVAEPGQTLALQAGVEAATSEVVLMLDDDVLPEPGLVEGHARHHANAEGLVVLGYMPVARPARRRRGEFAAALYLHDYEGACERYDRDPDSILTALWAGNVSIRRSDCLRVGLRAGAGMPDGYGYHEDRDLGLRCRAAGLRGVFDRRLRARHTYEKTTEGFLRAARSSGATRAAVHATHADAVGPLPEDFFARGAPLPGRLLVRLARHRAAYRPVRAALRAIAAAAGALRVFRVETHAGFLLGLVEQQRGAQEAETNPPRGDPA
ncbi:MAG TPA: glycosyltransferase family 2 protein [Solirubrobacterales bacterium]